MSLRLLQPGISPLGQFDGYDADYQTVTGGEVCTFGSVATYGQPGVTQSGYDKAAYDAFDGYVNPQVGIGPNDLGPRRPVVTHSFATSATVLQSVLTQGSAVGPLMLTDDGILGYGTLFGSVVGGTVGQTSYGPNSVIPSTALLGPSTQTGSGKITCWDKPGLYAVSLTSTDVGLQPTNTDLDVGSALGFTTSGQLSPFAALGGNAIAGYPTVARLVEFSTNGSLVTTPNTLVAALNSPSGIVSSVGPRQLTYAVISFRP